MSQFFTSGDQSIGVSASASVLPMNIQHWFPLRLTGLISLQSKGLSRIFFNTTIQKHQFRNINFALSFLFSPALHPYLTTGKTIALTRQTFVGKVMSLLFNMLSTLVIAFLPRSKHVLVSKSLQMVTAAMKLKDYLSYCSHFLKGNFLTIYVYQIITFYPLTLHNMVCQSYPNKAEKFFWELAEFQMNNIIPLKIMREEIWEPSVENTWDGVQRSQKFITLTVNYYIRHHLLYLSLTCLSTVNLFPDSSVILSHELPCSAGKSDFSYKPINRKLWGREQARLAEVSKPLWISKWGLLWFSSV